MSDAPAPPTDPQADPQASQPIPLWDVLSEMALYASTALIIAGLILPSVWKPNFVGFGGNEYNLFGVVQTLREADMLFLAIIVVLFSGVFPLAKTITAAIIFRQGARPSPKLANWLNMLGKWSMLDVFLAALLIGISQMSVYLGFETRAGLYYFAFGVLLNNAATMRLTFTRYK